MAIAEAEVIFEDCFSAELVKEGKKAATVVLVSDSAAVIALGYEVTQGLEGQGVTHIVNVYLQLSAADAQVALSELIGYVPPQWPVLPTFLN